MSNRPPLSFQAEGSDRKEIRERLAKKDQAGITGQEGGPTPIPDALPRLDWDHPFLPDSGNENGDPGQYAS